MQTVRVADTKDCELINRMAQEAFPFTYRHILEPDQIEYMMHWMYDPQNIYTQMTEEGHVYFVAYQDDEPAGYVSVRPDGESLYHLEKIYVLPEYQNKGIAQAALKEIERMHNGCKCWILDTILEEKGNCHLYEKLGYVKIGEPQAVNEHLTLINYKKEITATSI